MATEKCDVCGRFGAKAEKYFKFRGLRKFSAETYTLYLCSRCEAQERAKDGEWMRKTQEQKESS